MKTKGFEQCIGLIALAQIRVFLIEQGDIHQAAQALLLVHHRQCQETMPNQQLAGIENGGVIGQCDDGAIHQLAQPGFQWCGKQTAAG